MSDFKIFISLREDINQQMSQEAAARNVSTTRFIHDVLDNYLADPKKYGVVEIEEDGVFQVVPCTLTEAQVEKITDLCTAPIMTAHDARMHHIVAHAINAVFNKVAAAEPEPDAPPVSFALTQARLQRLRGFAQENARRYKL